MTSQPAAAHAATTEDFVNNLAALNQRIAAATSAAGREADSVRLLPVTKTIDVDRLSLAIAAGVSTLGENKVQEAQGKHEIFREQFPHLRYAIIGPLQTNKAKFVAQFADEFHALDSLKLAETLQRRLELEDRTLEVFIQVNTSGEESKSGISASAAAELLDGLSSLDRLNPVGLMTMAAHTTDEQQIRASFSLLRQTLESLQPDAPAGFKHLSMGMSGDYELAIAEGATVVRVGQGIFGARNYA
ncbi:MULTISPECIES: YggS family pyridoxal phosphate-dependent enzyme [unclassified Glutamicibacter]|uniref:YggS family pyridoxal phosphate-dependent enzyme n=1 Tax=unclassified Glutamicibacter TaxID=2627139 RepID=UPI0021C9638D|nr:YggS family pyridoxal phosphate-dependent enzyme [Glutamicibacter sp. M10]UXN30930.1 YggS family pyridoxal phosphate-dependent enzyme [Glutamicibacter sp. M10]